MTGTSYCESPYCFEPQMLVVVPMVLLLDEDIQNLESPKGLKVRSVTWRKTCSEPQMS